MTTDECIEWLEYQGNNRFNLYTTEFLECAARLRELEARAERYRKALHALVEDMELVLSHDGLPESDALRSARDALGEGE